MQCGWLRQHVSIDSLGLFRPCCGWRTTGEEIVAENVNDYLISDFRKQQINKLENNQWPTGCEDCKLDEQIENHSLRTGAINRYKDPLYTDAEVKFGNMCNLACVMCSPDNSSLIEKEYIKHKGKHELFDQTFTSVNNWYTDKNKLQSIAWQLSDRNQIRFTGGEPTVNNYLIDFLTEVKKHNTDITIKLTTNGNNWPTKLHDLLSEFKTVISVSIDARGVKNDYIRWPSNWEKINRNVNRMMSLPNSKVECGTTIASYNVHLMEDLAEWVTETGFINHNIDPVWSPEIFRPCNTTDEIKHNFVNFAKTYEPAQRVIKNVNQPGTGLKETIDFLQILDYNRSIKYQTLEI
jgi:MoaA/NifB/PqqE/SkfB family radical SAM enzyme